jgi:hypothetical protein
MTTATLMRRKVKMEQERGEFEGNRRMMPGTPLVMVDVGQALG